ncbi:aminotransferase class III-fold pyridoxal phosphate-dependent enzyme [Streptomyces nondiastaticus]|uniref:Aminotransferase class III-fold pyridoxal phosphate-dependent enzyme n=1 Tax=Streptomyces nondiastaticus TaxID=3154512 RepID=A0ABW6TQK3_9ACTN
MQPLADSATDVWAGAAGHLVPGMADRHRLLGLGAFEAGAEGAEVHLSSGRKVLDFGSYAVPLFGHRPQPVTGAVRDALDTMPVSTRLLANPYAARLAARLAQTVDPGRLNRAWLGLNGSDAVEAALKLALARTGRSTVLAVEGGFHGKTLGALATTFDPERRKAVQGFLGAVRHVPAEPDAVARAAAEEPFAALIVEPVQGEGGGRAFPAELLRRWSEDAHAAGAFVIADEIQCGLRRCGAVSLSVEAGMRPDVVLFGKALGGGVMPLSAALTTDELFAPLVEDPYFHTATFAGHPLSCAAGLAALDLLDASAELFPAAGEALAGAVAAARREHPRVLVETRVQGLFGALEFATEAQAGLALLEASRRGLLLAQCLTAPRVLRMLPPVVTTAEQWEQAASALLAACRAVERKTVR